MLDRRGLATKPGVTAQDLSEVTTLILAGGYGTRLQTLVADRPKVLALVCERPFLFYLLDHLSAAGVRQVILCTGYLGDQVRALVGGRYRGLQVEYSEESAPLGTAGALRLALPLVESKIILAMNGDSYACCDLSLFLDCHRDRHAEASLLLVRACEAAGYGRVLLAPDDRLLEFQEKPADGRSGWINAGVYLLDRAMLESIPPAKAVSLEREVLPSWLDRRVFGYRSDSPFIDIGTPETYHEAPRFFSAIAEP